MNASMMMIGFEVRVMGWITRGVSAALERLWRPMPWGAGSSTLWILEFQIAAPTDHRRGLEPTLTKPLSWFLVNAGILYPKYA